MRMVSVRRITFLVLSTFYYSFGLRYFQVGVRLSKILPASMFSGIIEEIGTVESLRKENNIVTWDGSVSDGYKLEVIGNVTLDDAYIGCSISLNGVCLTVTEINSSKSSFSFGLAPETLRRSNLKSLSSGNRVNLERAMLNSGRNSGHVVQGHVDCTGEIIEKWKEGDSLWIKVQIPREYISCIVPKGFISIDGTSLTICDVQSKGDHPWFTFMLVPHTQNSVIIPTKQIGEHVNIEVDVIAKLIQSQFENVKQQQSETISALLLENEKLRSEISNLCNRVKTLEHTLIK